MPSRQKRLLFSASGLLSLCCALTASVASGLPFWISGSVLCRTGAELVNATGPELDQFLGDLNYGLFHGQRVKQCGLGGRTTRFSFFPDLLVLLPVGLHVSLIFFCGLVVLFSSVSSFFFFFNAFGRPYETLHGPLGLYVWTASCGGSSALVMVLFGVEVQQLHLSRRIVNFQEETFVFQPLSERYDRCFWLFLLIFLLQPLNFLSLQLAAGRLPFLQSKGAELSGGAADLMY